MEIISIQQRIFEIRGYHVMLDFHLTELFGVETKRLKEAVRRNMRRFPLDFMFELTNAEYNMLIFSLMSQNATSNTSSRGGIRYVPFAFTEHGVTMLSSVLNSDKAIEVNVAVVRAFIAAKQVAIEYIELRNRLESLEFEVGDINNVLEYLMTIPKPALPEQ
ncbi:MAG: ORF6N domain-containing protein [Prevotellaceae bacterium]|jgi:ABC-type iron transport system FetAB permease component|nr:ORF6N domain-containing protein [Prevotellaceae bacterium]